MVDTQDVIAIKVVAANDWDYFHNILLNAADKILSRYSGDERLEKECLMKKMDTDFNIGLRDKNPWRSL